MVTKGGLWSVVVAFLGHANLLYIHLFMKRSFFLVFQAQEGNMYVVLGLGFSFKFQKHSFISPCSNAVYSVLCLFTRAVIVITMLYRSTI